MKRSRVFALLLCVAMVLSCLSFSAGAADASCSRRVSGSPFGGLITPPDEGASDSSDTQQTGATSSKDPEFMYEMLDNLYRKTAPEILRQILNRIVLRCEPFLQERLEHRFEFETEPTDSVTEPVLTQPPVETIAPPPTEPVPVVPPTTESASSSGRGSGLLTADDNDITGFTPKDWSWTAEGEGYGRRYFTSGKYVRDDGRAVLYIESSDSGDGFSFQLFVMADGGKQSNFIAYDYSYGTSYSWASNESEGYAKDISNGLYFTNYGNGLTVIASDWIDEMYYEYSAPDGYYYLVREKK